MPRDREGTRSSNPPADLVTTLRVVTYAWTLRVLASGIDADPCAIVDSALGTQSVGTRSNEQDQGQGNDAQRSPGQRKLCR